MLTRIWNWIKSFFVKEERTRQQAESLADDKQLLNALATSEVNFLGYCPTGRGSGNSHQRRVKKRETLVYNFTFKNGTPMPERIWK